MTRRMPALLAEKSLCVKVKATCKFSIIETSLTTVQCYFFRFNVNCLNKHQVKRV